MYTLLKIILGAVIAWLVFMLLPLDREPVITPVNDSIIYDSMAHEIDKLKDEKDKVKDSLFGAEVERGRIEIELNKSNSELERLIKQNKKAKIIKDTVAIVNNCDSIMQLMTDSYVPIFDTLRAHFDNTISIYKRSDSIATSMYLGESALRHRIKDDLFKEKIRYNVLLDQNRKTKKRTFFIAAGGIIIGAIGGILLIK